MKVVSQQADQLPSPAVEWDALIRGFGRQHELQFNETLQWIANRTSLQVACEVLGVTLSPSLASRYTVADLEILYGLGDFLWVREYTVPRLMEYRRLEYVWRGRTEMGFSLSKEEYLKERATGKSKNKIAQSQGISGPALFHWLDKWGLKDAAVEQQEMARVMDPQMSSRLTEQIQVVRGPSGEAVTSPARGFPRTKLQVVSAETSRGVATIALVCPAWIEGETDTPVGAENSPHAPEHAPERDQNVRQSSDTHAMADRIQVQFAMPLRDVELPATIDVAKLTRDELMQSALKLIQGAIGQAYNDLATLLGEPAASQQIQAYVQHQLQQFLRNSTS